MKKYKIIIEFECDKELGNKVFEEECNQLREEYWDGFQENFDVNIDKLNVKWEEVKWQLKKAREDQM